MKRLHIKVRLFAAALSGLAGFVDAVGFLALGGYFVSFMSGNSTRMAVGLSERSASAGVAAGLIGAFLGGVVAGSMAGRLAGAWRRTAVVGLVTVLLGLAGVLVVLGSPGLAPWPMAVAMGAENAVFEEGGEVRIGLTYMTGTLVKLGQGLASLPFGGDLAGPAGYLLLWCGLIVGAVAGATAYGQMGLSAVWIAVAAAAALCAVSARSLPLRRH
jgi:uncharacterized membrane protein YoaK (UPF0700 family)